MRDCSCSHPNPDCTCSEGSMAESENLTEDCQKIGQYFLTFKCKISHQYILLENLAKPLWWYPTFKIRRCAEGIRACLECWHILCEYLIWNPATYHWAFPLMSIFRGSRWQRKTQMGIHASTLVWPRPALVGVCKPNQQKKAHSLFLCLSASRS